ncbi:MAG: FecR domain-containing protein [Gammaproteobacteria bacterium]
MDDELDDVLEHASPLKREAAAWFARLRADDVMERDKAAFQSWLATDARHRAAYERLERVWSVSATFAGDASVGRAVHEHAHRAGAQQGETSPKRRARAWAYGSAAAAALAICAVGTLTLAPHFAGRDYSTRVGEQRTIALDDGSRLTLNTDTKLNVRYARGTRLVRLARGEAYFRVAKDSNRPFLVDTGQGTVRAVGTEFDVYRGETDVTVTLVEGKVLVGEREVPLIAGQRIVLNGARDAAAAEPAAIEKSTSWLSGRVIFDNEPLRSAAAELNRYSQTKVLINGTAGDLRITGVFLTDHNQTFVSAVQGAFSVTVARSGDDYVLTRRQ